MRLYGGPAEFFRCVDPEVLLEMWRRCHAPRSGSSGCETGLENARRLLAGLPMLEGDDEEASEEDLDAVAEPEL